MSSEQRKVLDLLAAGKISAGEAEQLLGRLSSAGPEEPSEGEATSANGGSPGGSTEGTANKPRPKLPRYLRIVSDSPNRDSVDVRVPFGLIRTGLKLSTLVPGRVSSRLSEQGIDLSNLGELNDEELIAELAALQVDVASDDGGTIRVFCESSP